MKSRVFIILVLSCLASCRPSVDAVGNYQSDCPIYPDYMDVTIPASIAPLNFSYVCEGASSAVTVFSCGSLSYTFKGADIRWKMSSWHRLMDEARGGCVKVTSSLVPQGWSMFVSEDGIDYGLNYRLIEPGYEIYSRVGIYERELSTFKEHSLLDNSQFYGCLNCHEHNMGNPDQMNIHIRGPHGCTVIKNEDDVAIYNTKTDSTISFCAFCYWHPSSRFLAYSTNKSQQGFHLRGDKILEVNEADSDVQVYSFETGCLMGKESVKSKDWQETYPSFSPDGKTLYFTRIPARNGAGNVKQLHYNLCKVSFDPETGEIGDDVTVMIDAEADGKSISFPRPSYDGRFIMYTLADYGLFPGWHHEADLWLLDLQTGQTRPIVEVNSDDSETFHNWSTNSRWFVFGSRRDDGLFTRAYIAHISEDGTIGRPFMIPQKDPLRYYNSLFMSYNLPEFVTGPATLDGKKVAAMINKGEKRKFGYQSQISNGTIGRP